jgi:hypothetical protein
MKKEIFFPRRKNLPEDPECYKGVEKTPSPKKRKRQHNMQYKKKKNQGINSQKDADAFFTLNLTTHTNQV